MSIINSCKNISYSYKKIPKLKNFSLSERSVTMMAWGTLSAIKNWQESVEFVSCLSAFSCPAQHSLRRHWTWATYPLMTFLRMQRPWNVPTLGLTLRWPQLDRLAVSLSVPRKVGLNYWVTRILFSWTEPKITVNGPTHSVSILPSHAKLRTGIPWPLRNRAGLIYVVQHRSSSLHFFRCLSHFFSTQLHIMLIMSMNDELGTLSISRYSPSV